MVDLSAPTPASATEHGEDLRMMQLVVAQDEHARRMVARRLVGRVARVVQSLLGRAPWTEDAVQQALLEILRSAPRFEGNSSLEWWADRITVRVALRMVKKERKRAGLISGREPDAVGSAAPVPLADALPRSLAHYLDELAESQREALVLRHALGYSLNEIASQTETNESTVKYRINAALRKIRKSIAKDRIGTTQEART
jgi:RNA polymerase sigma-70 factor (ECF subfamily)